VKEDNGQLPLSSVPRGRRDGHESNESPEGSGQVGGVINFESLECQDPFTASECEPVYGQTLCSLAIFIISRNI
jgi:hypothetical protein